MTSLYHLDCHRVRDLRPNTLLKKLLELDAIRRPERFEEFLLACEADARGRLGLESREYTAPAYFRAALRAVKSVDIAPIVAQQLDGPAFAAALDRARKAALVRFKEASHEDH